MKRHLIRLFALALLVTLGAPGARAASALFDKAPADRDLYVFVDFARLAKSPHMAASLAFLGNGLKAPLFRLPKESGLVFGDTVQSGLLVVHKGAARVSLLSGAFDLDKTRAWLQAHAKARAEEAARKTEEAKARAVEAAKQAKGGEPAAVAPASPDFVFAEKSLGGKPALLVPGGIYLLFWSKDLVLAGTEKNLNDALPVLEGKAKGMSRSKLFGDHKDRLDKKAAVSWIGQNPTRAKQKLKKRGKLALADVDGSVGNARLTDTLKVEARVFTRSKESAKAVSEYALRRVAKVRERLAGNFLLKGLAPLLDGVKAEPKDKDALVSYELNEQQVTLVLNLAGPLLGMVRK
jgi:hypothetical protein